MHESACHSSQLGKPGDYLTLEIFDQDIVITNTREGGLKAFYNVCQHRGHKLAEGSGNRKLLVCPYHAWSYDLQGKLRAAPHANKVPGFDNSQICLTEIRLENFLGFVFINLDPEAAPMAQWYPGLAEELAQVMERDMQPDNAWQVLLDEDGDVYWVNSDERVDKQPARGGTQRVMDKIFKMFPKEQY